MGVDNCRVQVYHTHTLCQRPILADVLRYCSVDENADSFRGGSEDNILLYELGAPGPL